MDYNVKKKMNISFAIVFFVFSLFLSVDMNSAKADLMITPLRAVFEGRDRAAVITLINNSNEKRTYRMGWDFLRMTPEGRYDDITADDVGDLAKKERLMPDMVRFSPRQVSIEPGGRQRIRLSLRKGAELADGEYRAHLTFTRLPKLPEPENENVKGSSFILHLNLAFSIPIIVRQGQFDVASKIEGVSIIPAANDVQKKLSLMVDLSRLGNQSTFGRLRVYGLANGKAKQIGILNNVAIFPEIDQKHVRVPLQVDRINYSSIKVVYEGDGEFRGTVWDEKIINISG